MGVPIQEYRVRIGMFRQITKSRTIRSRPPSSNSTGANPKLVVAMILFLLFYISSLTSCRPRPPSLYSTSHRSSCPSCTPASRLFFMQPWRPCTMPWEAEQARSSSLSEKSFCLNSQTLCLSSQTLRLNSKSLCPSEKSFCLNFQTLRLNSQTLHLNSKTLCPPDK